jgi:hypothetical protein
MRSRLFLKAGLALLLLAFWIPKDAAANTPQSGASLACSANDLKAQLKALSQGLGLTQLEGFLSLSNVSIMWADLPPGYNAVSGREYFPGTNTPVPGGAIEIKFDRSLTAMET